MVNRLELIIRKAGRNLEERQVASLFKVPEAFSVTPCDFFGYTRDGRAIMIEAKHVNRGRLPIGQSPGLAVHQWNALESANKAGCLALICWARGDVCATITMDMAIEFSRDSRSIPWTSIAERFHRGLKGPEAPLAILDHWLPIRRSATPTDDPKG